MKKDNNYYSDPGDDYEEFYNSDDDDNEDEEEYDEEDEDYEELNPDDYTYSLLDAVKDIIDTESGNVDGLGKISVIFPITITPVNKFYKYPKYPYEDSMIVDLVSRGLSITEAVDYTIYSRIDYFLNDYILKDDDGNLLELEDIEKLPDIVNEMYPDIYEPYWYIKIDKGDNKK